MSPRATVALGASLLTALSSCARSASPAGTPAAGPPAAEVAAPAWAYPIPPAGTTAYDSVTPVSVPGSAARYTEHEILARLVVPDWHPDDHPPMPPSVARGRPATVSGCAFCHLPNGMGRPENASLDALPAEYIVRQVADMKSGARKPAWTGPGQWAASMYRVAMNATDAEIAEGAAYFAALRPRTHVEVVETAQVPVTRVAGGLYALVPDGGTEPLGDRLIEVARDHRRHERHDDLLGYVAYVPRGSLARGARLSKEGPAGPATACATCHGPDLRGVDQVPSLAGRSPSHMLRQLLAFKAGTRHTPAGEPMRAVVAAMSTHDMVAAVAYAASRKP